MAQLSTSLKIDVSGFVNSIKQAVANVKELGANIPTSFKINADTKQAINEVQKLNKEVKNVNDTAKNASGGLSSFATGLMAGGGLAIAQIGLSAVTGAIKGVFNAALEADEIGDKMELSFRQAGLSGKELDAQLDSTTKFARKLGDQFAESPAEIKKLSIAAASLGGATGKANEDMTKLALGISKASDGAISGEKAIRLLSRGAANPEDQAALDSLTKKFPALGNAMKGTGDQATKVNASLLALAPTFATLEAQSTGIDAIAARFSNAGNEALQSFGGGIMSGLDKAGAAIAGAAGGIDFEGLYETAKSIGDGIGEAISTAVVYVLDFYEKVKPIISFLTDVLVGYVRIQFAQFKAIIGAAFEIVGAYFATLQEAVQPLIDVLSELFASTGEGTDYVQEFIDTIKEVFQVVVGVGKVLIEFLVIPIKLFVTEVVAVIGWIGKLINHFKSTSDGAQSAAGGVEKAKSGFEKFREVLQNIQAFLAGVAGGMEGLASDAINLFKALASFDFSKIKDAFMNFGAGAKQGFTDGWNQKKSDIASDTVVAEFEKQIDELDDKSKELTAKQLAEQKKALSDKVAAQKSYGKISLDQEVDLQSAIAKLGQSADGKNGGKNSAAAAAKKLKDISDEIAKAKRENANIQSGIDIKQIADEMARELKAAEEKTENAKKAVADEITATLKMKDVAAAQKEELIKVYNEREKLLISQGEADKQAIKDKFAKKELDNLAKLAEAHRKRVVEDEKALAEMYKGSDEIAEQRRILSITDSTERELQTKLAALKKQYDADIILYRGNEEAKADLKREYDAKRYDAELEAQNKSKDLATMALNSIRDLGMGIAQSIRDSMGNTFDALNKSFDDFASNIKKKIADAGVDNSDKTGEEGKKLIMALKAQTISYQEFQAKSSELNKKKNSENVTSTERANLAIGLSFQAMAKSAQTGLNSTLLAMGNNAKAFAQKYKDAGESETDRTKETAAGWKAFTKDVVDSSSNLAISMAGVLGQMAAQGELTAAKAAKVAVGMALDAVSQIVMVQAPAILAMFAGSIPAPFGFIAGIAAIASVQALLAVAKSSITGGFFSGGYTGDGATNSVAGVVHGQEVVFESGITSGNKNELLALRSMMQNGTRLKDIIGGVTKSSTYVDATGKLNSSPSNIFSDYRSNKRLQAAEFAVANTGKTAQAVEFSAMQNSLKNIEKLLAKPSRQKSVSQVQINIEENQAFKASQQQAALRLERARGR